MKKAILMMLLFMIVLTVSILFVFWLCTLSGWDDILRWFRGG